MVDIRLPVSNQAYGTTGFQGANQFGLLGTQNVSGQTYGQTYGQQNQPWGTQGWGTQGYQQQAPGFQGQMTVQPQIVAMDCLNAEKFACTEYAAAALESANPSLRNTFLSIEAQEQNNHRRIWEYLNQRGYYQVEPVPSQMVSSARNRASQQVSALRQTTGYLQ